MSYEIASSIPKGVCLLDAERSFLYVCSIDGVVFKNNLVVRNNDCAAIASNKKQVTIQVAGRAFKVES